MEIKALEVVVDNPADDALCFGAVADKLALRHVEFALMCADSVDLAFF